MQNGVLIEEGEEICGGCWGVVVGGDGHGYISIILRYYYLHKPIMSGVCIVNVGQVQNKMRVEDQSNNYINRV